MSFKIRVPRTNYIKNTRVDISPIGVNKGVEQGRNVDVGNLGEASAKGSDLGEASSLSKGVYKELQNEKSYTKVEDNGVLKPLCTVIESDKYDINKNCLKYEQESVDYDISKLLKHDSQSVKNSFDLIKDIDDCGKINEIFNKMFCDIDNNTLRDKLGESLKNKKNVEPVLINKFNEVVDFDHINSGLSFFSKKKESTNHNDLSEVDYVGTGFFDVDPPITLRGLQSSNPTGGPILEPPLLRMGGLQSSRPTGGESEANPKKISFPESGPIGDCLFELTHCRKGIELNNRAEASFGSDCSTAVSKGGDSGEVVNTKVLNTECVNIKKKNPRRKKNKKNKRV